MRFIFTLVIITLFFSGCSHKNAFTNFNMNKDQELSTSSLQSSKVRLGKKVEGVFSAIYLNEVYPNSFNQYEYFFIYLYLKDEKVMHNPNSLDDIELTVKLNGELPVKIKELPNENQFSKLTTSKSAWKKYYLVAFKEQKKKLNLVLESGRSSSAVLSYQKDQQ